MADPIRVLHVFGCMNRGGAELRTLDLYRNMDRKRLRFDFCVLSGRKGSLDSCIRELGGEVFYCDLGLGFGGRFRALLRDQRFDVVQSHVHYASGMILRHAAKENVPVRIAHFRSSSDGGKGLARLVYRALMRRWIDHYATRILAVSEGAMSAVWGANWSRDPRCRVIYNGIDLSSFDGSDQCEEVRREFGFEVCAPVIIHVGRMDESKNHPKVIGVFCEALRRDPSLRLLMVGRGGNELEQAVKRQVENAKVEESVRFAGERNDVPRLVNAADLMLHPSLWEGLSGAVLEACAAGTPVLASDLGSMREIADRLPSVQCISLDADEGEWAAAAANHLSAWRGRREESRRAFLNSVFEIHRCAEEFAALYAVMTSLVGGSGIG